jgi:hypothetical protein
LGLLLLVPTPGAAEYFAIRPVTFRQGHCAAFVGQLAEGVEGIHQEIFRSSSVLADAAQAVEISVLAIDEHLPTARIVRTALEDKTLLSELPGYKEYAEKVRFRLIPGVW